MNKKTQNAIRAHALRDYPDEACGVVINADGREEYVPCRNMSPKREDGKPKESFRMSHEDLAEAEDRGALMAVIHSHPDESANPTASDRVICEAMAAGGQPVPWYIVSVYRDLITGEMATGEIKGFVADGYQAPLVGREFFHGSLDCWTLVRDWWKRERGIEIPDFDRDDEWWKNGGDMYTELHEEAGFVRLPDDAKLEAGDLIVMQIRAPKPNHGAVYLGDNKILHHVYGYPSSIDVYAGGHWQELTRFRARHRSMLK